MLASLVVAMFSLEKRNQLCSLHAVWRKAKIDLLKTPNGTA
jgi:hypothetical protein